MGLPLNKIQWSDVEKWKSYPHTRGGFIIFLKFSLVFKAPYDVIYSLGDSQRLLIVKQKFKGTIFYCIYSMFFYVLVYYRHCMHFCPMIYVQGKSNTRRDATKRE